MEAVAGVLMLWIQIRRDRAWRLLPLWIVITVLSSTALLGLCYTYSLSRRQAPSLELLVLVVEMALVIYLLFGTVHRRASDFEMSLPLSTRRLWLGHLGALMLSGATILAASALAVTSIHRLVSGYRSGVSQPIPMPELDLLRLILVLAVGLVFVVVLLESNGLELAASPRHGRDRLRRVTVLAAGVAVVLGLAALPLAWVLVPLALALVIGNRSYRSLPPSFSVVPRQVSATENGAAQHPGQEVETLAAEAETSAERRRRPYRSLFLILHSNPKFGAATLWLACPFYFLFGMLYSDLSALRPGMAELRFLYIPLGTYMLLAFVAPGTQQLHHVEPLPVSRRLLFLVLVLPGLATLSLGYGAGTIAAAVFDPATELVEYRQERRIAELGDTDNYYVFVPIGAWEIAWDGQPPANVSPWGESHPAWRMPVYRGSRIVLYSPYATPAGSSLDFVALQISRAMQAVYGESLAPEEIRERFLEVDAAGKTVPKNAGLGLRRDFPELRPRANGPAFPIFLTLVVLPWWILVALFLRTFRTTLANWVRQAVFWGSMVALFGLMVMGMVAALAKWVNPLYARGFLESLIRDLGGSPGAILLTWAVCGLLLGSGYWLAQEQFRRIEIPLKPTKFTLCDWTRSED